MKRNFTFFALIISFAISAQIVNIPDPNFKAYLVNNSLINTNGDTEIQVSEANSFTGEINLTNLNNPINDLTGIQAFTKIKTLVCEVLGLTSLDVSKNTELEFLDCSNNKLTTIDVTKNVKLTTLDVYDNKLSTLDISKNILLEYLYIMYNKLTEINTDSNLNLKRLDANYNPSLKKVKVQNNIKLQQLYCGICKISELDLRSNTNLTDIILSENELVTLLLNNGYNSKIMVFNTLANPSLTCIQVDNPAYSNSNWTDKDSWTTYSTNCSLSVNDVKKSSIQIYPNPVRDHFVINTNDKIETVEIYSPTGQLLKTFSSKEVNISSLPKGNYLVKIKTDKDNLTQKIIKE